MVEDKAFDGRLFERSGAVYIGRPEELSVAELEASASLEAAQLQTSSDQRLHLKVELRAGWKAHAHCVGAGGAG